MHQTLLGTQVQCSKRLTVSYSLLIPVPNEHTVLKIPQECSYQLCRLCVQIDTARHINIDALPYSKIQKP